MTRLRTLPDRDLALILRHDAGRYILAANTVADRSELDLLHPCYFLRCHAIELLLKACLLATGSTLAQVEAYLHKLDFTFEEAKKRGLVVTDETSQTITRLSGLHQRHQFKYRKSSRFEVPFAIAFPNDEVCRRSLNNLFEQCGLFILGALKKDAL
jgi:hypothetical protein